MTDGIQGKGKFIYCFDKNLKQQLELKGFKLIYRFKSRDNIVWVFENTKEIFEFLKFSEPEGKYMYGNKMYF